MQKNKKGVDMEQCETVTYTRWTMKQEILEDLENYDEVNDDVIREICDSLVPVYNHSLVDFCSHFSGEEYWDIWLGNELGGDDPISILRGNVFCLYVAIGQEVLSEMEEE